MNTVTNHGNPTEIDPPDMGPTGLPTFAQLTDLTALRTNYNFSAISYYNNPAVNVKLANNLKTPTVDELQASFAYSFNTPSVGAGSVKATAVSKKWKNLFDYRAGNDGLVTLADGSEVYMKVWENSNIATRDYKGLELEGQLAKGAW